MPYEITVSKDDAGISVKTYLKKKIDAPYPTIVKYLNEKRITLNGKKIKKDAPKLNTGDVIKVWLDSIPMRKKEDNSHEAGKDLGIPTIFENEDFIVLNKLAGVIVQGGREHDTSLPHHLDFMRKNNGDEHEYRQVHRLDKETSGLLIIGKNPISIRDFNEMFRSRQVEKVYTCLCNGLFDKQEGTVDVYLKRTEEGAKEKVIVTSDSDKEAKRTITHYKVLKEYSYKDSNVSLVEVSIETGFMHQIRVHMKHLGHPIVCDKMYGNSYVGKQFEGLLGRHFLHATKIAFKYKDKQYNFRAELEYDLSNTLKHLHEIN